MSSSSCPCPALNWQNEPAVVPGSLAGPAVDTTFTGCPCPLCVTTNEAGQITGVYYTDQVDNVRKHVANCSSLSSSAGSSSDSSSSSSDSASLSGSSSVASVSSQSRPSLSSVSTGGTGCCTDVPEFLLAEIIGGPGWLNGYYVLQNLGGWPPAGPTYAGCWVLPDTFTTECTPLTAAEFSVCCDGTGTWKFYSGANVLGPSLTPADSADCDPFQLTWVITVTTGPCTGMTYLLVVTAF
jgi:hypothetical protein